MGLLCALTFFFIFLLKGKRYAVYPYLKYKKKQATHHLLTHIPMIGEVVKKSSYVIWTIF
jgi:type II secretory pathway component PulF